MPTLCTRIAASRESGVLTLKMHCENGYATTPPPKGVEPAIKEPAIMARPIGQKFSTSPQMPFLVRVKAQSGQTKAAGANASSIGDRRVVARRADPVV